MADQGKPKEESGADRSAPDAVPPRAADGPPPPPPIAAKAKDLEALRNAVVDAASVGAALWFSYLFVLLYLVIALGSVTHKNLFLESPVKLPFLNVDLPLIGFFVLGPALFLIVHAYVLLHFVLLADKVGAFHSELQAQIDDDDVRARLRRQLPSNIFVQFLAGPFEVRTGLVGAMLRLIALISLVAAPIALLVFFQLQFLPYQGEAISCWQRLAVVADLALLWTLWPSIGLGEMASWRTFGPHKAVALALASLAPILLVFTIATFPGEWLHKNPLSVRFVPTWPSLPTTRDSHLTEAEEKKSRFRILMDSMQLASLHQLLIAGDVDLVARKPRSLWSYRLVVPGIEASESFSLRGRRLEGAVLSDARLKKVDFTATHLQDAMLNDADLAGATFGCAERKRKLRKFSSGVIALEDKDCARLQGANLERAQLQGASLDEAKLQGASLAEAELQGASLEGAQLQGATLDGAQLQGASLNRAQLQFASLTKAQLQGASLKEANLEVAEFDEAQLQGALLEEATLENAWLSKIFAWRADARGAVFKNTLVIDPQPNKQSAEIYAELKRMIEKKVPQGKFRDQALRRIEILDPAQLRDKEEKEMAQKWDDLNNYPPSIADFERGAVQQIESMCKRDYAPYVVHAGFTRSGGYSLTSAEEITRMLKMLLDETKCPDLGLSEEIKMRMQATLKDIRTPPKQ